MKTRLLSALIATVLCVPVAHAAIIPVNQDPDGTGLNDPTARAPEGGNPGTTVGEQRRIVYQFAADLWGSVLETDVDVRVAASFPVDLGCTSTSATLGAAAALWLNWNFPNAPLADTIYHSALANQIAGENINATSPDYTPPNDVEIYSFFNANLGQPGCLDGIGWYYGLDGNTPANQINFLDTVMHEIGHGLGFSGFVGLTNGVLGNRVGANGTSDIYTHFAYDNVTGARFDDPSMDRFLRRDSMATQGRVGWDGDNAKSEAPAFLGPKTAVQVTGATSANFAFFGTASFGAPATSANFDGDIVIVDDGAGPDNADACEPLAADSLTGKVAFINRGTCSFEPKAANAEAAGAIAVIIGNVEASASPGDAPNMGPADPPLGTVTIPVLSLNLANANVIRTQATDMHVALGEVEGEYAGADSDGRPLLYAPSTVANGSTFSHFDISLTPDAVMEPFASDDTAANLRLDLTPAVFQDEGWVLKQGNAKIGRTHCDTWVPLMTGPGIITGANIVANDNLCSASGSLSARRSCMQAVAAQLKAQGLITSSQERKINTCTMLR
jgi:hypothetical protein